MSVRGNLFADFLLLLQIRYAYIRGKSSNKIKIENKDKDLSLNLSMFFNGLTSAQRINPRKTGAYSKISIFVLPGVGSCWSQVFVDLRFSCVGHVTNYSSASLKWLQVL
ncbi:hypothetical protein EDC94DRAFT_584850 [Helicostylum pulchrum]|nr:hypothetical protein EDC94DRAFT_584850 [Helicostylum pulchrum]